MFLKYQYKKQMKIDSGSKKSKYQNQSLMTLNSNAQGEPTKKTIQTDQYINFHPIATANNRKYVFTLPISFEITSIISLITTKFSEYIIHAQQDNSGGYIMLTGIRKQGFRRWIANGVDFFTYCFRKAGSRHGRLEDTYNIISINIKKQVIQQRCSLIVTNPYRDQFRQDIFQNKIINGIQDELKILFKQNLDSSIMNRIWINPFLNENSPVQLEISIYKKIFSLYIFQEKDKQFSRFKVLFQHSLDKIRGEIEKHRKRFLTNGQNSKVSFTNPSIIVEKINYESQSLLDGVYNYYKDQQLGQASYLYSLISTQTERQISLYSIQSALCIEQLENIKQIYQLNTKEQCEAYNKQIQYLNLEYTDNNCFDHLELRDKFRLPNQNKPYFSSIQTLKKVVNCKSLREMLLIIQKTFSNIKTDCLMSHSGKLQIVSMDDLLPVMIFVTVRANIKNFPVYVKLIDDYVRLKSVFELQQRVITTLYVAIEDISKQWRIKQQSIAEIILK